MTRIPKYLTYFGIVLIIIFLDQGIKAVLEKFVLEIISLGPVGIGNFQNSRGLFGLVGLWGTICVSLIVMALVLYFVRTARDWVERVALLFMLAGGAINLYERIALGYVRDNFLLGNLGYFNLADMAIVAGLALIIFESRLIKLFKGKIVS